MVRKQAMRTLGIACLLFGIVGTVACQPSKSPGGGTKGSATPNPAHRYDGGPQRKDNGNGTDATDASVPEVRDGSVEPPLLDGGATDAGTNPNGPGVDRTRFLDELTEGELMSLCEWVVAQQGGAGEKNCGDGLVITVPTVSECVSEEVMPHCEAGVLIDCMASLGGDACAIFTSAACADYFQCVSGG